MSLGKKDITNRANHRAIIRAAQCLEEHLDEPIQISELARTAGMSMFHFQRVFRDVVGETVKQHQLRLRLERAAYYLKFSNWQLQEISLSVGFSSQASFSRAFQKFYHQSPSNFRKDYSVVPFLRSYMRESKGVESAQDSAGNIPSPTVCIHEWPELEIITLRYYGSVSKLVKPWRQLLAWAKKAGLDLNQCRFFGLWFDDWSDQINPNYRYECAILTPDLIPQAIPEPFLTRRVDAGSVAVAPIYGTISALDRAWRQMMSGWLPFSGYQPRLDFVLDEYPAELMISSPWVQVAKGLLPMRMKACIPVMTGKSEV